MRPRTARRVTASVAASSGSPSGGPARTTTTTAARNTDRKIQESRERRDPCSVGIEERIDEIVDLVEVELRRSVRIKHRRVVHVLAPAGESSLHSELLHVDVGANQRRELRRQRTDPRGLDAVAVDETRHLDRATRRKVINKTVVRDVAVHNTRLARLDTPDDRGCVFETALNLDRTATFEAGTFVVPAGDLFNATPRVLVERDIEALDQIGAVAFHEPRHVLGEVLARLGDEIAEASQHLVTNPVRRRHVTAFREVAQPRVEVLAVTFEAEIERHVVDARGDVLNLLVRNPEVDRQLERGALHAVAQTNS